MDGAAARRDLHCCFIIQAAIPYFYDLNQILALPAGFRYHNRYNQQWVDPTPARNRAEGPASGVLARPGRDRGAGIHLQA